MLVLMLALALSHTSDQPTPKWTATTQEAAATDANKKVLAEGQPRTITGEVVDVSCYTQMGKRGEGHKKCGAMCVRNGEPVGILTADNTLYLLMPEAHHPRRDAKASRASLAEEYAEKMGTNVTVSGMATEHGGVHTLFIDVAPTSKAASTSK